MPYVCSVERIGIEKGLAKGLEQGLEQGIEQGKQQGLARVLTRQLTHRFGELPVWVTERLNKADINALEAWAVALLSADSIEAVFSADRH